MRMWGGRFDDEPDARMADFTRSIDVDAELALDDIAGSIAHVRGLGRAGPAHRRRGRDPRGRAGRAATRTSRPARSPGTRPSRTSTSTSRRCSPSGSGRSAGKLHTGRSRNDQVATDLRLWTRRAIDRLDAALVGLERALVDLAEREGDAVLPGTTHIQPAQPVLLAHHLLAYVEMLERDRGRLADARAPAQRLAARAPERSPARATRSTARRRPRSSASRASRANSLDAVSDRDFVVEVLAAAALAMVHLSRLAEEVTWWSNPRFGFVRVADAFSTGSSMMPNKKNPDPAELVRGRTAGVIGGADRDAHAAQGPAARLPARPPGGQAARCSPRVATLDALARASWPGSSRRSPIDRARMRDAAEEGYTTATALADALVRRGVPFRAAHHIVGGLVGGAEAEGIADARRAARRGVPGRARRRATTRRAGSPAEKGIAAALRDARRRGLARGRGRHRRHGAGARAAALAAARARLGA